ncbi:LOW QUALITY PROTEIN: Hypothetical protein PHPALM_14204 [Phytophthora palmivora]|uniref:Integrase catalytic domain-containing protein n=1 Tax=Phytophthora palmivora TaxID=4796 RepID=A0A2P4XVC2_9STRA|nr:LOW QUALITY PROTEIN: Hypothetical protein PHPALM_14204 [Phytophthora palmivora]
MGYSLARRGGKRVLVANDGGHLVFDMDLRKNVLVVEGSIVKLREAPIKVIMAGLGKEALGDEESPSDVQQGTLVDFHKRLGHLNYDSVERPARDLSSGIVLTDHKRANCLTCAEDKQSKGRHSLKDSGANSPIDLVGGVIFSGLKGPMTPRKDRLGNRYMINFVDHKSNYVRVKNEGPGSEELRTFIGVFKKELNCKVRVSRTDSGGKYENVDMFCKSTGVVRQRSEANNQASNGKSERMHRTVINMARCLIFACSLPLGNAVH